MASKQIGWEELAADLQALVSAGLLAVTGPWHEPRYVVTPDGELALKEHDASVRAEARELAAKRRHPAYQLRIATEGG